jgi:hypothetical protein
MRPMHRAGLTSNYSLDQVLERSGGCHILVNGAGVNSPTPFLEIPEEEYDRIMNINTKAVVLGLSGVWALLCGQQSASIDHQSWLDVRPAAPQPRLHVLDVKGGGAQPEQESGPRMGTTGNSREHLGPRLLSCGTKSQSADPRSGGKHHAPHAHESLWRSKGTGRRGTPPCRTMPVHSSPGTRWWSTVATHP